MKEIICDNSKDNSTRTLIQNEIFIGQDKDCFYHFRELIRFCRNVLAHNIREEIQFEYKDFYSINKFLNGNNLKNFIFEYDYGLPPFNKLGKKIKIEFDPKEYRDVQKKIQYTSVVTDFQNVLIMEFCYNIMTFLEQKYSIKKNIC